MYPHEVVTVEISVPSSSGKSLQPEAVRNAVRRARNFSPLFIGEITSTSPVRPPAIRSVDFSPLFIGEITSTEHGSRALGESSHFSPLFIVLEATVAVQEPPFQSPLHRGNHFNAWRLEPTASN